MVGTLLTKWTFDDWSRLARESPTTFEEFRCQAIDDVIRRAPPRRRERLRRLQWRIDQERRLAPNPLAACLRISAMMWASVHGQGGLLDRLNALGGYFQQPIPRRRKPASAVVVPIFGPDRGPVG